MINLPIQVTFEDLVNNILSYNPLSNIKLIEKAFLFAKQHHGSQVRKSGEPYYTHPLAVANIAALFHLDDVSIICSLLHDVVEDTKITINDINTIFNAEIARIVDGVTKLNNIEYKTEEIKQAENLRKLFLALSEDIRVLLIKLCDRLHNMLTIRSIPSRKRRAKAIETLEVYAPLAERVGMYHIRELLQDLSFGIINSRARNSVLLGIEKLKSKISIEVLHERADRIKKMLSQNQIQSNVFFRIKSPYSIWKKMQHKAISFDDINDIIGYRIIAENQMCCYQVLFFIHQRYKFLPNSFMDYISTPKQNGYRSLHSAVIDKRGNVIEFQIRTAKMHDEAEFGLAAHWGYKAGNLAMSSEDLKLKWINRILTILESPASHANEILEYTKLEMYKDKIFTFSKSGEILRLPAKSKILDFAFLEDSESANRLSYAKINGVAVHDLDTELKNGDRVEIITAKNPTITSDWTNYVVTGKAKYAIKKHTKNAENYQNAAKGMEILNKACSIRGVLLNTETINIVMRFCGENNISELYLKIYSGKIDPLKALDKVFGEYIKPKSPISSTNNTQYISSKKVYLKNMLKIPCTLPKCCQIEYFDNIQILFQPNQGAFIHSSSCKALNNTILVGGWRVGARYEIEEDSQITGAIIVNKNQNIEEDINRISALYNATLKYKTIDYSSSKVKYTIEGKKHDVLKLFKIIHKNFPQAKLVYE